MADLTGVVIGADIDNTLHEPDPRAYEDGTRRALNRLDIGLSAEESYASYEYLRRGGGALERMGLGNPRHCLGHPDALAVLCLTECRDAAVQRQLGIDPAQQAGHERTLQRLFDLHERCRTGSFVDRLRAEVAFRHWSARERACGDLARRALALSMMPPIADWSARFSPGYSDSPPAGFLDAVNSLRRRGATVVAISDGLEDLQRAKLERIGLAECFTGHALISQGAEALPGLDDLDRAISERIDTLTNPARTDEDEELQMLWHHRCLIGLWSRKTPWFYARCLHAIRCDPRRPEQGLRSLDAPADPHRGDPPMRFVMIGDRWDRDVRPVIELLGRDSCLTVRLTQGRYGQTHIEAEIEPLLQPHHTFPHWDDLIEFLVGDLTPDRIGELTRMPDLLPRSELHREHIEAGLGSRFEAVRVVANVANQLVLQDKRVTGVRTAPL